MTVDQHGLATAGPRAGMRWGLGAVLALTMTYSGCEANQPDGGGNDTGSGGMFGLFRGSKPSRSTTTEVAAAVGAALVAAPSFPATVSSPPKGDFGNCREVEIDGVPPDAKLLEKPIRGQTTTGYRIDGMSGQPPLVLANIGEARPFIAIWELGDGNRFAAQRPVRSKPRNRPGLDFCCRTWPACRSGDCSSLFSTTSQNRATRYTSMTSSERGSQN